MLGAIRLSAFQLEQNEFLMSRTIHPNIRFRCRNKRTFNINMFRSFTNVTNRHCTIFRKVTSYPTAEALVLVVLLGLLLRCSL